MQLCGQYNLKMVVGYHPLLIPSENGFYGAQCTIVQTKSQSPKNIYQQ